MADEQAEEAQDAIQGGWKEKFDMYAEDDRIRKTDLIEVMTICGANITDAQQEEMMNLEKDDFEFHDFCTYMEKYAGDSDETLREAFATFDKDGNGLIDKNELQAILGGKYSEEEIDLLFEHVDQNEDGKLNYEELVKLINQIP